jgi:hypothetical protein
MALHLAPAHALASVAGNHCEGHTSSLVGGVACGSCWERAIRDDERFAVENELPRQLTIDPDLVDNVAVERAMQGQPVRLTPRERAAALAALSSMGIPQSRIARLLHTTVTAVTRELARPSCAQPSDVAA